MAKVKEMTVDEALKGIQNADAKLQAAAAAYAKGNPKGKEGADARKALREAALDFATADRYYRSARAREQSAMPLD